MYSMIPHNHSRYQFDVLQALAIGIAERQEAESRQDAEQDGHGLSESDCSRNG